MDAHRAALEEIALHPELLGIKEPILETRLEVPVRNKRGRVLTDIDVLFLTPSLAYVVEVKTGCRPDFDKAYQQSLKARKYANRNYPQSARSMIVWYKDERIIVI